MGLQYYIYLLGTPAVIEVRDAGQRYCVGTLNIDLAGRSSAAAAWVTTFGGAIPQGDLLFGVSDDCSAAPGAPSATVELMQLESPGSHSK